MNGSSAGAPRAKINGISQPARDRPLRAPPKRDIAQRSSQRANSSVAIVAPTGRDGLVAERILESYNITAVFCPDVIAACAALESGGAGVLMVAEEALDKAARDCLLDFLARQPSWSDIPIILLTGTDELSSALPSALEIITASGNVTLLERPVRLATLTTILRSALRARERQLDVRELVLSERAARQQAEEANKAKSQFLATMSHELRTPLNAISGYSQIMELGLHGPITPAQREDLERINRSQRHLLALINDILNFAKIEAGRVDVEAATVNVDQLLLGLKEFVEPQLQEKQLEFSQCNNDPSVRACADPDKVRQILINLLSNAIKFTPPAGKISLDCDADDKTVTISVADNGDGIPSDKLEAIFEPFVQIGRDFNSSQSGTGLGLAISRDLARRMEGELTVESTPGEGSTFSLTLPRDKSPNNQTGSGTDRA
ncbi:MAG TPA: ATP-binding protein [Gemmatimonadaceae bacterium]|nr:ATP-binding protein [Gemmatimonadaceae bacterium]